MPHVHRLFTRVMSALLAFAAVACVATAIWHGALALGIAPSSDHSSPARHGVFVVVNLACAAGLLARPRFFVWPFAGLVAQQLASHGGDIARAIGEHRSVAITDVVVVSAMPALLVLLVVDRARPQGSRGLRSRLRELRARWW